MEQMKNCHMLALYARCGVYWCQFETIGELNAWQQAISAALEELEEQPKRTAKAAAFVKLEPLIWQQLLSQTENMRAFVSQFASYDGACASEERVREKHNGWLYVRQSADEAEEEDGEVAHALEEAPGSHRPPHPELLSSGPVAPSRASGVAESDSESIAPGVRCDRVFSRGVWRELDEYDVLD